MFVRLISNIVKPVFRYQRIQYSSALLVMNNRLIIHNLTQIRLPVMDELNELEMDEELLDSTMHTSA